MVNRNSECIKWSGWMYRSSFDLVLVPLGTRIHGFATIPLTTGTPGLPVVSHSLQDVCILERHPSCRECATQWTVHLSVGMPVPNGMSCICLSNNEHSELDFGTWRQSCCVAIGAKSREGDEWVRWGIRLNLSTISYHCVCMCSLDVHRRRILELVVQPAELGHGFRAFYATTQTPGSRLAASCS